MNNTYLIYLPILFLLFSAPVASQAQNSDELDRRNGFKDIKMGEPVTSIQGAKFKKSMEEKTKLTVEVYQVKNPRYQYIGKVKVKKIEIYAYKGLIYRITIITHKDKQLMTAIEKRYGKSKYDLPLEQYYWHSKNVNLTFKNYNRNEILLTYLSYPIWELMKQDKKKEIDDIKDDL